MPQFVGEQYSKKELAKLASWQRWGSMKAFLHAIHEENKIKCQARRKAHQWLEGIGI